MCCQVDCNYVCSKSGALKIIELLLGAVCLVCLHNAELVVNKTFLGVVIIAFIETCVWYFIYLLSSTNHDSSNRWLLTELILTGIVALMYLSVSTAQIVIWVYIDSDLYPINLGAGCLGLVIAMIYGLDFIFQILKPYSGLWGRKDHHHHQHARDVLPTASVTTPQC